MSASSSSFQRLPLQDLALTPGSLKAYNKQLNSFLTHARLSLQQLLTAHPHQLDRLVAVYIQHSYNTHTPFTYASHALHAVVYHRPDLKQHMFVSRQCLKGWERVKTSASHPPLTWELTVVLACTLSQSGYHGPAVAMLVAFDCYLRVGELTRLRRCDIVMPNDSRMGRAHAEMAVCLPTTKTGPNQSVSLQNPVVAQILCDWVRSRALASDSTALIFAFKPPLLRRLMHQACTEHGLGDTPYVPHSLRHGGATADFLRTKSIEHVQFRGRWKSMESARRYVQTARALLAAQQVPQHLNTLGQQLDDSLCAVMQHAMHSVLEVVPRARRVTWRL